MSQVHTAIGRGAGQDHGQVDTATISDVLDRARARVGGKMPARAESPATDACINCGVGRHLNIMPDGVVFPCHILADARYRCGDLRHESLIDICRNDRLLGRLAGLDFRNLAASSPGLAALATPGACLGDVLAQAPEVPT